MTVQSVQVHVKSASKATLQLFLTVVYNLSRQTCKAKVAIILCPW